MSFGLKKDWNGELSYGLEWVRAEPSNPDAWYVVAAARETLGQLPGAIEAAKHAIQLNSSKFAYWFRLCESYMRMGTRAGYQDLARGCASHLPQLAQEDGEWFSTGNLYYSLAELQPSLYQNAKEAYLQDLKLSPKAAGAWQNLGNTEWQMGHLKDAEDDFQKAIQLGNTNAAQNLRMLQQFIQACFNQKQTIDHTRSPDFGIVQAYNQHCGSISGEIPVQIIRVP
jgi:tetratricopeptide (TPR) repeat protein